MANPALSRSVTHLDRATFLQAEEAVDLAATLLVHVLVHRDMYK